MASLIANPSVAQQKVSRLNIVIAGSEEGIVMVESGALEVSEETVVEALEFGHAAGEEDRGRHPPVARADQAQESTSRAAAVRRQACTRSMEKK